MKDSILLSIFVFFLICTTKAQLVTNNTELQAAITNASAGSEIILSNGTWNNVFININKSGNSSLPITITAQNPGSVFMTGNSRVYMRGNYVTISGLVFQNPSNLVVSGSTIEPIFELNQCDNCKVINNKIDTYNGTEAQKTMKFKWVYIVDGQYNEIAHNSFIGKYGIGSIINDNRSLANADYLKIHHNYFADRTPINGINDDNDQDAIRIGTSTTSLSDSFSEVYENYFYNFFGEIEIISNKSGQNKYYNNTFRKYGGGLTLRHGNNCEVYGNYFFAENNDFTLGVRLIGEGHKVYNNYIEGINSFKPSGSSSSVTGGINVMNGVLNSPLNGYYQVKNAQVVNNTFVNCDYALRIGTSLGGDQAPENLTVANNIMYNTSINAYQINTTPIGTSVSEGNITNLSNSDIADDGNFHRLTSGSSPIDASLGSYSFLTQDILEGNRDGDVDAGAEEFGANGIKLPYKAVDVGETIGFLSSQSPSLSIKVNSLQERGVILHPIPTNGNFLHIKSQTENIGQVEVFNVRGKSLLKEKINQISGKIEVSHFSPGVYIIKIRNIYSRFVKG
jgi:poly(beta-D-mannuronate) lyase